jgi:hypothetical protein
MSKQSPCPRDPSCTSCHVCDPDTYPALVAWRREGLRAASSAATVEQLRAFERELRRRDSGFMGIDSTNITLGTGTYEARSPNGQTVPKPFTFTGSVITTPTFAGSVNAGGPLKGKISEPTPSPDPYQKELAAMRAASATPESDFAAAYRAKGLAALNYTHAALDAAPLQPRLTAAERADIPAIPDPYSAGIKALRDRDARALAAKENR